jgi:ADP-ribosyl-[dinitrogen reductase] hydrolase
VADHAFTQRALGAVIGSAVGDALGAPFEFKPAGRYTQRFPEPVVGGIGEMVGGGTFGWAPGEFTDDTQMAIVQAESVLACGGVDGADLFERFRVWAAKASDVGIQTRSVLTSGLAWDVAAAEHFREGPGRGAGNGSLMRATPAAVYFAASAPDATVAAARATSAVTHGDPATGWGTALYHLMIRAALHGDDPFEALRVGLDSLPADQDRYVTMLDPNWDPADSTLPNGAVWTCLAQAVWAVRDHDSFPAAVVAAIDLGGDTDTVAAVAGGLAGAIHGIQGIPSRWPTYLHGHVTTPAGPVTYRLRDLQTLTLRLLGNDTTPEAGLGPPRGPTELAPGLFAADLRAAGDVPTDWAVVSLCRVADQFTEHPLRREVYLVDKDDGHNPGLARVIADVVDTIDAFLAEGRPTVVHCHHGASRTGLVLRAWLMHHHGWDAGTATDFVAERWPVFSDWNTDFTVFLATAWPRTS